MELFCQRLGGDGFRCMLGQKMHDRGRQERVGTLLFIQGVGKAQKFALDFKRVLRRLMKQTAELFQGRK